MPSAGAPTPAGSVHDHHVGTQPQREIFSSMLLPSSNGTGTNTLLLTGRLESSALLLLPCQHPLHAALPRLPQVRVGCWGLGQCGCTEEGAEQE